MSKTAADQITSDITLLGEQTRQAARRYEGVFADLRAALDETLAQAADLGEAAVAAMTLADAAADAFVNFFPNQPHRDCRAGCDACCHLYVMIPPGVADAIQLYLTKHRQPDELADLRKALERAAAAADALPNPTVLRHRCPLLGADGLCTIYEVRPLTCRAFTSRSAQACRSLVFDSTAGVSTITQNPSPFRVYVEATAALERAGRLRGSPDVQMGLAAALLAVYPQTEGQDRPL